MLWISDSIFYLLFCWGVLSGTTSCQEFNNFLDVPVLWNRSPAGSDDQGNVTAETGEGSEKGYDSNEEVYEYIPHNPRVLCSHIPLDFSWCEPPLDLKGNITRFKELQYGCYKWGGQTFEEVLKTPIVCHALEGIECSGNRTFLRPGYPCMRYSNHYFLTHLLYSIFLGFWGIDRFCLGHTGTAVGKLLTMGGLGFWWLVDIIMLIRGDLTPADGSAWMPMY